MHSVYALPPFGLSDHDSIFFSLSLPLCNSLPPTCNTDSQTATKKYIWEQGDYSSMSVYLSQYVWEDLLTVNFTADDLWNSFRNVLNEGIDLFVPYKYVRSNNASGPGRRRRCPKAMWRIKNKKLSLYKAHRSNPSNTNIRAKYKQECAKYKRAVREDEIEREKKILDANNVGSSYKYVNSKLKCHSGVGTLIDSNGNDVVDDRRKANLLNDYFCSVGTIDNGINPPIRNSSNVLIDNIHFDELKVIKAAKKIRTKHKNTCDHEGYPILLLTKLISVLSRFP